MAFPYTNDQALIWNFKNLIYFYLSDLPTPWICLGCSRKPGLLLKYCVFQYILLECFISDIYVCQIGDISLVILVSTSHSMLIVKLELNLCIYKFSFVPKILWGLCSKSGLRSGLWEVSETSVKRDTQTFTKLFSDRKFSGQSVPNSEHVTILWKNCCLLFHFWCISKWSLGVWET